jgi:uncharacterized protein (DUF2336 family)
MKPQPSTKPGAAGATFLSQSDVARLLSDDSEASRVEVLEKVSTHYNTSNFGEREREVAEQIFRLMMKDATLTVRETLARRIAQNPDVPRDIVLHLACDVSAVSVPILSASTVLSDADLVQLVESSRELSKLMAIAARTTVSERVSDALVDTQYPEVIGTLLGNEGAAIHAQTLSHIVDVFGSERAMVKKMAGRANLPLTIVEKLLHLASAGVAEDLRARYPQTQNNLTENTHAVREDVLLAMIDHDLSNDNHEHLVAQMEQEGRLSISVVMNALCRGHLSFFRAAIAKLAGIPTRNATRLLADKGELGVQALYDRSGLPESMFSAVRLLLQVAHKLEAANIKPGTRSYANNAVEQLLVLSQGQEVENLPYIMALMRQNSRVSA